MKILSIVDQEDGSATVTMDMEPSEVQFFIEQGFVYALVRALDKEDQPKVCKCE